MNILIVDDDPFLQKSLSFYLLQAGHLLSIAGDGQKALDMLEKNRNVDLIICDVNMPVLTGPSFILTLKRLFHSKLPVIMIISGIKDGKSFLRQIDIKHDYYFEKPLDFDAVVKAIDEAEKKKQS